MRKAILTTLLVVAAVFAAAALADAGANIGQAPELPSGERVEGGHNDGRPDFWRITMRRGDRLTIDYESTLSGERVDVALFAPSVTDFTLDEAEPLAQDGTRQKDQFRFAAPSPGRYTLRLDGEVFFNVEPYAYSLTAYVRHVTSITLSAPRIARAGTRLKLAGKVNGAAGGEVLLQVRKGSAWKTLALTRLSPTGAFAYAAVLTSRGVARFRATYAGDATHLASAASVSLRVV
jgi:hypothetical protein